MYIMKYAEFGPWPSVKHNPLDHISCMQGIESGHVWLKGALRNLGLDI